MLLEFSDRGIYCKKANVYIDPWKPVDRALITHGHADHSRWGNKHYLCTHSAKPVIQYRLGNEINIESVDYGEPVVIDGVKFSFHPAGHILGSAQIRVEYKGEVWVASGDYKTEDDLISEAFEPVKCHTFITESTFGLPVYDWKPQQETYDEINAWWKSNKDQGKASVLTAYALGKAQRILQHLDDSIGKIYTHGAVENVNEVIRQQGVSLKPTIRVTDEIKKEEFKGSMILATPGSIGTPWLKRFLPYEIGTASGWMSLRGARRRRSVDRGFVLSDHADWKGLNQAIDETGAERVFVTHGYTHVFSKWLETKGLKSYTVETQYEGETLDADQQETSSTT